MRSLPVRRTADLRKGRASVPEARYFVTCCLVRPTRALVGAVRAGAVANAIRRLEFDGDCSLNAATIMPDHVHLLFGLGNRLSLSRMVAKLKGLSEKAIRSGRGEWQENFFEHRLRADEPADPYAKYIFMNPYCGDLIGRRETWPYWLAGSASLAFTAMLEEGNYPPPEWKEETPEAMGLSEICVGVD